ncbi:MAG: hypothetical protein WCG80_13460 [Spirochaetales bacterium]
MPEETRSDDISLVDLIRPLHERRRLLLSAVLLLALVCLGFALWTVLAQEAKQTQAFVVKLAQPLAFKDFQDVAAQVDKSSNGMLTVDYKRTPQDQRFPKGRDPFEGYFDDKGQWTQVSLDTLYFQGPAIAASLKATLIEFQTQRVLTRLIDDQIKRYSVPRDLVGLLRAEQKTQERLALLGQFEGTYPSLIRPNLTLNDRVIPVESQIMSAQLELQNLKGQHNDIALDELRSAYYQAILGLLRDSKLSPTTAIAVAYQTVIAGTTAPLAQQLASERTNLEYFVADRTATIPVLTSVVEVHVAKPSVTKELGLIAVWFAGGLLALLVVIYTLAFAARFRANLTASDS